MILVLRSKWINILFGDICNCKVIKKNGRNKHRIQIRIPLGRWKENGIKEEDIGISNLMIMFYFLDKMVGYMNDSFIVIYMVNIL